MKAGPDLDLFVAKKLGINLPDAIYRSLSTKWEGIRLVVEEMNRRGHSFFQLTNEDGTWYAAFSHVESSESDEAPHAVCLAALKALD